MVLRSLLVEDAEELFGLIDTHREELSVWLVWVESTLSVEDSKFFIASNPVRSFYEGRVFGIFEAGRLAGTIGFHAGDCHHHKAEVGYWLAPPFQGRGVMTRACSRALEHAFQEEGLHRCALRTDPGNHPSRALARRLGFTLEGLEREGFRLGQGYRNSEVYSLLSHEW